MPKPTVKVELEVDETATILPFFTLDDPEAGVLDNLDYPLGGLGFVDVTQHVVEISTKRGISRELQRTTAGVASVALENDTRIFDPQNASSNFSTQLLPRRQIRITYGTAEPLYLGQVDDWNLVYDLANNNLSIAESSDRFTILANQTLEGFAVPEETTGNRVSRILDRPEVNWSAIERVIDTGNVTAVAGTVVADANVLDYLTLINQTENGGLFIGKDGYLNFQDGQKGPSSVDSVVFSSEGDGVPFTEINVVYGSELLYNRIVVNTVEGYSVTGDSTSSQTTYGILTLTLDNFFGTLTSAIDLVSNLLNRYDQPEYRFDKITVDLTNLPSVQQNQLLGAELFDVANIKYQPNNIGSVIDAYAQIIGISNAISANRHLMSFNFRTLAFAPFVLDDAVFGVLGGSLENYDESSITYDDSILYDGTESPFGNRLG